MTVVKAKQYSPDLRAKKPASVKEIYRHDQEQDTATEQRITTSVKMKASLKETVKMHAITHHTTMGEIMEEALTQWLKEHDE